MPTQLRKGHAIVKKRRAVFLSFEFDRDAARRGSFIGQGKLHCEFAIVDKSLPRAQHDDTWRQKARESIRASQVVIILLGPDTHSAIGVKDELSLAGEARCPVVQLMPQDKNYGLVAKNGAVCEYKWENINLMLKDPKAFAEDPTNRGK